MRKGAKSLEDKMIRLPGRFLETEGITDRTSPCFCWLPLAAVRQISRARRGVVLQGKWVANRSVPALSWKAKPALQVATLEFTPHGAGCRETQVRPNAVYRATSLLRTSSASGSIKIAI